MSRTVTDPIEYLVARRFPLYRALQVPPSLTSLGNGGIPADEKLRISREIENYRVALKSKTPEELRILVEQEQVNEAQVWRGKAERDEQERVFNQPRANANFLHWSQAVYWTLEEAIALAFGKSPDVVNWSLVQPYVNVSPFAREYARVRDLAIRAKNWKQLYDPVMPGIFLAWARRIGIVVPDELVTAVEARGIIIGDWQDNYEKLKAQFDTLLADRDKIAVICQRLIEERDALKQRVAELEAKKPPGKREESTLLNIVAGLLGLLLGKTPSGKSQSVFDNQASVIDALVATHGGKSGISERTLQEKFAAAKRSLES